MINPLICPIHVVIVFGGKEPLKEDIKDIDTIEFYASFNIYERG